MIRAERATDHERIRALHTAAFAPSAIEAEIVDALRDASDHVPELCLVAHDEGALVGHVMLSQATIEPGGQRALALGPIAVDPAHQHRGIGSQLMRAVIDRARTTDFALIALLGHPAYYPRFGFRPAAAAFDLHTTYEAPPDAWMALALPAYAPTISGTFRYAAAFPCEGR